MEPMQHVTSPCWHLPSELASSRGHVKAAPSQGAKKLVAASFSELSGLSGLAHAPWPLSLPLSPEHSPIFQRSREQPESTALSALQEQVIGTEKPLLWRVGLSVWCSFFGTWRVIAGNTYTYETSMSTR